MKVQVLKVVVEIQSLALDKRGNKSKRLNFFSNGRMCKKKFYRKKKKEQPLSQMINTSIRRGKPPVTLVHSRPSMPPVLQIKCRSRVDSVPLHTFENIIDMVYQQ